MRSETCEKPANEPERSVEEDERADNPLARLDTVLIGIKLDLYDLLTARYLADSIGMHAGVIKGPGMHFFAFTQQAYIRAYILGLARLLERPKGFPLRNVPALLAYIEQQKSLLPITNRLPIAAAPRSQPRGNR